VNIVSFLIELKEKDIIVLNTDGKLTIDGNKSALTSELVEKLRDNKSKIQSMLSGLGIESNKQIAPTTFSQQGLWFIDQLDGSVQYNIAGCLRLKGSLDKQALGKAFNTILLRHESLRTNFHACDEISYQVVNNITSVDIPIIDLSHLSGYALEQEISRNLHIEVYKPFILTQDLMLKVVLLTISDDENLLQVTIHHIAADGWSMGILIEEFSVLYTAFVANKDNPLQPLKIQYSDYAHWQRNWLQGDVLEDQLTFWKNSLQDISSVHSLPLDYNRPEQQKFVGNKYLTTIGAEPLQKLKSLCLQQSCTLFMGLHAIFSLLLNRYSGENNIVIGTPIANREQPDVAPLIGFFTNTLVLRSDLSAVSDFKSLLAQSKQMLLGAYAHQQISFESLVRELKVERSLSYSPIFQILMILQNNDQSELDLAGLTLVPQKMEQNTAQYDLALDMEEIDGVLSMTWCYNIDLFKEETISEISHGFITVLNAVLKEPERELISLPMLDQQNVAKMIVQEKIDSDFSALSAIKMFEHRTAFNDAAFALEDMNSELTYVELNCKSNQLAWFLDSKGIGKGDLVGVYLPRSADIIISMLAVMKLGAVYVPLDPDYPSHRLQMMIDDAAVSLLISNLDLTPNLSDFDTLLLDTEDVITLIAEQPTTNLEIEIDNGDLAYVIYTSGSTGKPKGVILTHGNISSYYYAASQVFNLTEQDCILQFSSMSFDIFIEEVFQALLTGAKLQLRNEDMLSSGDAFWNFIKAQNVSFVSLPTDYWHILCSQLNSTQLDAIKQVNTIVLGGASLSPHALKLWQKKVKDGPRILNTYGPTEATVIVTVFDVTQFNADNQQIPIGKSIVNAQCYVLDRNLNMCAPGVIGELYIAGKCVSAGYLNQSELTAERFIESPFEAGTSMYRTGDRARKNCDGELLFEGRLDSQVKIRGFRVELGEIETALEQFTDVGEAIVLIDTTSADKKLSAYLRVKNTQSEDLQLTKLRLFLKGRLPDYMIPTSFALLETLPMTVNGKIDRKKLLATNTKNAVLEFVAPQTDTEIQLAGIWCDLLGIETVSATANFFVLGGHSLMCIRLLSLISNTFKIELKIRDIFTNELLTELAEKIDSETSIHRDKQRFEALTKVSNEKVEELVI
jgi:amino acid adenylation domain-containing protein